jgi:hypothetical protein
MVKIYNISRDSLQSHYYLLLKYKCGYTEPLFDLSIISHLEYELETKRVLSKALNNFDVLLHINNYLNDYIQIGLLLKSSKIYNLIEKKSITLKVNTSLLAQLMSRKLSFLFITSRFDLF